MYKENDNLDYENIEKYMKLTPEELDRLIEEEKEKIRNSELVKKLASTPQVAGSFFML